MKKWEKKEWWEAGKWTDEDVEEMWKEELERLNKQPWFESGKPCRADVFMQRDWREEMELVWGKWGAEGIGKLKKIAVCPPHEYELNPVFEKEPAFYRLYKNKLPDINKWRKTFNEYMQVLKGEGIEIHYFEVPESPLGPWGFFRAFHNIGKTVTKGGFIVPRAASYPQVAGQYPKWLVEQFVKIGCPILHMLHGKAVGEVTPIYLAENFGVIAEGYVSNTEAMATWKYLLEGLGTEVWVAQNPGYLDLWRFPAGGCSHLDMVLAPVDLGLALVYPSFLDYRTIRYLKSKKIRLIEVPPEEYVEYGCNTLNLEPGKIVIPAAAKQTIKALKREGVECIEIDYSENAKSGLGGPACMTTRLYREPGPSLDDL